MSVLPFTGAARLGGVVGHPIAHSLSPLIHNLWIAEAGMDAVYVPFGPVDEVGFDALMALGRAGLIEGINVTAPFKERAFRLCDVVSDTASACGSANIVVFRDGRAQGDSSDGAGLIWALAQQAPSLSLTGIPVVVLGAGGAARAAALALSAAGARVRILNRTPSRAQALARDLGGEVRAAVAETAFQGARLVINALSVQPELDPAGLDADTVVMDMTYRPLQTPFLRRMRAAGLETVDGLAMLIGQARPSFRAIFGQEAPTLDPRPHLLAHLGEPE